MNDGFLDGWNLVIVGGDAREKTLMEELIKMGAKVAIFSQSRGESGNSSAVLSFRDADAWILPLSGMDRGGNIASSSQGESLNFSHIIPEIQPGSLLLSGKIPQEFKTQLQEKSIRFIETADLDELAVYNAIPTAEGAIAAAMRESVITLHGSKSLVIGFGRCAKPLARLLAAFGAQVSIAARRRDALALAETMGYQPVLLSELSLYAGEYDFLFNTVPAMVLPADVLKFVKKDAVIIDISSLPGGTDFETAKKLQIKGILALGLPGKAAPVSAGKILAKVYPTLLIMHGKGGENYSEAER